MSESQHRADRFFAAKDEWSAGIGALPQTSPKRERLHFQIRTLPKSLPIGGHLGAFMDTFLRREVL